MVFGNIAVSDVYLGKRWSDSVLGKTFVLISAITIHPHFEIRKYFCCSGDPDPAFLVVC